MVSRKKNPYACAGKLNARNPDNKSQKNVKYNASWSEVKVTPEIKARFLESGDHMVVGEPFPSIVIKKDVHPGEEIMLETYGKGFWARQRTERANKGDVKNATTDEKKFNLKKLQKKESNYYAVVTIFTKQQLAFLDSLDIKNLTRDKRGVKRVRAETESEAEAETQRTKKKRRITTSLLNI